LISTSASGTWRTNFGHALGLAKIGSDNRAPAPLCGRFQDGVDRKRSRAPQSGRSEQYGAPSAANVEPICQPNPCGGSAYNNGNLSFSAQDPSDLSSQFRIKRAVFVRPSFLDAGHGRMAKEDYLRRELPHPAKHTFRRRDSRGTNCWAPEGSAGVVQVRVFFVFEDHR